MGMLGGGGEGRVGYVRADGHAGGGIFAYGEPGGGIFAKTAKTPPLQSALRGWHCVSYCAPNIAHFSLVAMRIPCTPHAAHLWGIYGFHNDAARRVATVFENLNGVIETSLPVRWVSYKRLTPYEPFAAVSLLEYGGLNPILPILGGRSDAARRIVIWPSCLSPMGTYGLYHGTTLVREGTREKGEHSLCSASPLPRT